MYCIYTPQPQPPLPHTQREILYIKFFTFYAASPCPLCFYFIRCFPTAFFVKGVNTVTDFTGHLVTQLPHPV